MDNLPVFDTAEEYRTWKALNGKLPTNRLDSISTRILSADGYVHPAIILSLIEAIIREHGSIPVATLKTLSSKARPQDVSPAIRITELLVKDGEITAAAETLSKNTSKDRFQRYLAEAELYHGEGDRLNSVECAKKGLDLDPSNDRLYSILKEDDPNGLWADKASVETASRAQEAKAPKDPRLRELYDIYNMWYHGNKDAAGDMLINSRYYARGDWEFMLVSARTNADEKDWRSAKMVYDKIVDKAPSYVLYEAAEANIAGHYPEDALELYDRLDQTSVRSMQGRIMAYARMGSEEDMMDAIHEYLGNEYSGTADYAELIDMLISSDNMEDAKALLDRMARSNRKDSTYLISYSKYLMKRADIHGAKRYLRDAVRYARGDPAVRVLMARMKLVSGDIKGAEKDCNRVLETDPDNLDGLQLKKDIFVRKGDVNGALVICKRILENTPNDVGTMLTLSTALSDSGDQNAAMMTLRNVLRIDPSRENVLKVVGSMIDSGMNREAMFLCIDLEKELPPDPMIRRLRGNAEYNLGEYMKASATYASAAELSPHDAVIWYSKGMADEARGDLESAEASYDRAVVLDLNESEYWISKAAIQEKTDDLYGAVESLNRAIELDPDSIYPMIRKAVILEGQKRYSEAMYFVDLCTVREPSNPDVALLRVRILRESGNLDEAISRANDVFSNGPSEASALELAACYLAAKKRSDAVRTIEKALKYEPDSDKLKIVLDSIEGGSDEIQTPVGSDDDVAPEEDAASVARIAESMLSMGDYKGALRSIENAISMAGEETTYVALKASILIKMNDVPAAQVLISQALKEQPKSAVLHESMGDIRMAKSEYRGALQEYEKAISMGLSIPEVLAKKGDAQQGLGYYDRSIDTYLMAVNRDPDNIDLRYTLAYKLFLRGYMSRAEAQAREILDKYPEDVQTIILFAQIERDSRKDHGVTEAYDMFRLCKVKDDGYIAEMVQVLESAGHDDEAKTLIKVEPVQREDTKVKRAAEKVLRRAYVSRSSPEDEDFIASIGFEGKELREVHEYIMKELPYGNIVPGSPEFQKMERASNEVIMKIGWKDIEAKPVIPLEKLYAMGSYKDVDEAKRLRAYIKAAATAEVVRDDSLKMVLDRVQGTTVFEIMRACKVGVYQARQIQLLKGVQ